MADLWFTPEYPFRVPKPGAPGTLQEIVIDVTRSAPTFAEPSKAMKAVFDDVLSTHLKGKVKILDFGAAKLRNTLYLFKKGHIVYSVEFPKVFETKQGRQAEQKANRYSKRVGRIKILVYPHEFRNWSGKMDLALLVNVLNIMPVPAERSIVLEECHKKLKQNGYLLWYSQYGDADYKRRCTDSVRLGDGFYIGTRWHYKTFYREFSVSEMDSIVLAHGFEFIQSYAVPNNHVRLYKKSSASPLRRVVSRTRVRREVKLDSTIPAPTSATPTLVKKRRGLPVVRPDPPSISHPADLAEALRRLPKGAKHAAEYVNLVKSILEYVLVPKHLKKIKTEKPIYGGRKRIDLFGRVGDTGFFSKLRSNHDIPAPYIHLECKNYSEDVGNPEFDQLKGRFSDKKGQFGILICRTVANEKAIIQRSQDATEANHYILVLTDVDLVRLIELREKDVDDDIDDFFAEMLEKVLL